MHEHFTTTAWLAQLSLEPVFGWWAVAPLALIMFASLWLTLSSHGISLRGRLVLMSLRLCAAVVLLLGWLRPGLITTMERETAGAIAVLMDRSQSMTLPSDSSGLNRWDVQRDVWQAIESATALKLGETRLIPYFYDRTLKPADAEDLPELSKTFETSPDGRLTDLGRALADISKQQIDPPLRGVILMGDAAQTLLPAETDATAVARQMAQLDQPIALIGIGPRGEQSSLKDIAIEGMPEYFTAFVAKEVGVPLVIRAEGMQNQPINVKLTLRASGKPDREVDSRRVTASRPSEQLAIESKFVVPEKGEYLLVATATSEAREQIESNNTALAFVSVREGGIKILYLEGQPRVEQTFLRRSLQESFDFDVDYLWFGEKAQRGAPQEISGRVQLDSYDAFIIGDLDASALTQPTMQAIVRRVQLGAGLLLMGGYHSYDAGGYGRTALNSLIPVEMRKPAQRWDSKIDETLHVSGKIVLEPTRPHPVTNLGLPEPDNTKLWKSLRPLKGMNRFGPLSRSPGTQTLLKSQDGDPVLVAGETGGGRVLAFAGDTTYQWFMAGEASGQKRVHQQFWRQALLWLIRRDSVSEGFRLGIDRRRMEIDATPKLSIEWFGGSDNKPMPEQIKLELSREGAWLRNIESTVIDGSTRETRIAGLDSPGLHRVALSATSDGETFTTDIAFVVLDESREITQLAADWQMMNNIVSSNQAAGGQLFLPEDAGKAIDWFRNRQDASKVTTIEKRRLGDAAWDAWLTLAVFCIVMSIEWGLRKSWQLP